MEDYLVRIIAKEAGIRAIACINTNLVNEVARRNDASVTATAVLGETLTAATLLGSLLKIKHRIAIKFDGDGPAGHVLVESDAYGKVRGYMGNAAVNTLQKDAPSDPYGVKEAIGSGVLHVSKDVKLKELVQSYVPLHDEGVTADVNDYLNSSEQVGSYVSLGVVLDDEGKAQVAGGILLQNLADYRGDALAKLTERLQEMPPIPEQLLAGQKPEDILDTLFSDIEYIMLEERPVYFFCTCSRERVEKAIVSSGEEEIRQLITDGGATVDCHFCNEEYEFDTEELEELLENFE